MAISFEALDAVPGFAVPVHRALTEPILLGGAPRSVAILNGTLAGAVGRTEMFALGVEQPTIRAADAIRP